MRFLQVFSTVGIPALLGFLLSIWGLSVELPALAVFLRG
jgi:hypothetical protein